MTTHSQRFKDKIILVTGAASGIGAAIATGFGAEGAQVIVNDVNQEGGESVANNIINQGGSAQFYAADVSSKEDVDRMFDYLLDQFDTLDVLVNNAGLTSPMIHFLEADYEWWQRILSVNLTGVFLCSHRAAHIMACKRSGAIINLSSGGATKAHRGFTAYDATKGGIEALTRAMALDLGPYGVRVNALVPGSIDTSGMDEETRAYRGANIPLGRIGESEDLVGPALFLASDDAVYITGHRVCVDGGMLVQQRSATVDIFPLSNYPTAK